MKFQVGQTLWYVPHDDRQRPYAVTIESVGRKWLHTSHHMRVNMETMAVDGGWYSSPGRCYLNAAEHDALLARNVAWQALRNLVTGHFQPPADATLNEIREARRILFKEA